MKNKKILLASLVFVFVVAMAFGSGLLYQGLFSFPTRDIDYDNDEEMEYYEESFYDDPILPTGQNSLDLDKDGLSNIREAMLGTEPRNADTDGGGTCDGYEVDGYGTNPTDGSDDIDELPDEAMENYTSDSESSGIAGTGCPD